MMFLNIAIFVCLNRPYEILELRHYGTIHIEHQEYFNAQFLGHSKLMKLQGGETTFDPKGNFHQLYYCVKDYFQICFEYVLLSLFLSLYGNT